LLDLKVVI